METGSRVSSLSRKRRRGQAQQLRLSWPAGSQSSASNSSLPVPSQAHPPKVRQSTGKSSEADNASHHALFSTKYAPKSVADLCVAPKKVREVETWFDQSVSKLLILIGNPGIGKSTMVRVLLKERNLEAAEWNESYSHYTAGSRSWKSTQSSMDYQSPLDSFEQFLLGNSTGLQPLHWMGADNQHCNTVILLDQLPHLHNDEAQIRFRRIMQQHVAQSQKSTIMIVSDVVEGKCQSLDQWIDHDLLYHSDLVTLVHVNPPTKARFRSKVVQRVAKAEKIPVSAEVADELFERLNGDARAALATLQVDSSVGYPKRNGCAKSTSQTEESRDQRLNAFHALGKLLYAKRKAAIIDEDQERPPLEFDPEQVVEQSQSDLSNVLSFLGYHCVDFFVDATELSTATDLLSDAAFLLDRPNQQSSDSQSQSFPASYVTSLAGRSVAFAKRTPAPTRFRQFKAPATYEVNRKRRANLKFFDEWSRSNPSDDEILGLRSTVTLATDRLPFMRLILPSAMTSTFDGLQSFFRSAEQAHRKQKQDEEEAALLLLEQHEILQQDDIKDFSDEDEDSKPCAKSLRPHTHDDS